MSEKTWDMVYGAIMDLTKGFNQMRAEINELRAEINELRAEVNELRAEVNELRSEMNSRFDKVDRRLEKIDANIDLLKIKQFDNENEIWILKTRQALSSNV